MALYYHKEAKGLVEYSCSLGVLLQLITW